MTHDFNLPSQLKTQTLFFKTFNFKSRWDAMFVLLARGFSLRIGRRELSEWIYQ